MAGSGSLNRNKFNLTAPASTFAKPVQSLSFDGDEYSQGHRGGGGGDRGGTGGGGGGIGGDRGAVYPVYQLTSINHVLCILS